MRILDVLGTFPSSLIKRSGKKLGSSLVSEDAGSRDGLIGTRGVCGLL